MTGVQTCALPIFLKAASAEKLKIEKEVAEKTRQLFETEYQKGLDAIDKKAKSLRKEGIKEVDIAKWVAIKKGVIQKEYDDKILAEIKKTNDKRIAAAKALFATIKEEEDKRVPDNVTTSPAVISFVKRVQAIKKIAKAAADNRVDIADISLKEIDRLYAENVISYKEHEVLKTKIQEYQLNKRVQKTITVLQFVQDIGNILMNGMQDILQSQLQSLQTQEQAEMGVFERRKKRVEDEKKRELLLAKGNATRINQINQDAANKEKQIDADKLKAKTAYDRKIAEMKHKQAVIDKAQALFNIAINTATAVMKVYAQTGIFGVGMQIPIMIMGALEAALVLARPIPKFAKGTKNAPGGLGIVGDAGAEIVEQDNQLALIEKPTLTYLKPGAKVYNNFETQQMFMQSGKDDFIVKEAIDRQTNDIVSAIVNKQELHFTTRGIVISDRNGQYFKEYMNRKIEF